MRTKRHFAWTRCKRFDRLRPLEELSEAWETDRAMKNRPRTTTRDRLPVVLACAMLLLAGCRHYSTRNNSPSDIEPPKDSSEATARRVLLRGAGSGLTPQARKVEQSLGYQ